MPMLARDGFSLHYDVAGGAGPNVLFIQGCGVSSSTDDALPRR